MLRFPKRGIEKIRRGEMTDIYIEMNDNNKTLLQGAGVLDSFGTVLNRRAWIKFVSWENESFTTSILTSVKVKPGRAECGVDENALYYVLHVWEERHE